MNKQKHILLPFILRRSLGTIGETSRLTLFCGGFVWAGSQIIPYSTKQNHFVNASYHSIFKSSIGLLLGLPTDLKHSSLSTDSIVCSIRIYDVLFLSETIFHCFLDSQVDFECWLRPVSVPEPATVIKTVLGNENDIPRVAGKEASETFPPECHRSSYVIFDSHWSMYRATGAFAVLWLTYRNMVFRSQISQKTCLKISENIIHVYVNACVSKPQIKTNMKQVSESFLRVQVYDTKTYFHVLVWW